MKKTVKALSAIILAIAMIVPVLSAGIVNAADGDKGSITIHKYETPETALDLPNNGTQIDSAKLNGLKGLGGISFKVTRVEYDADASVYKTVTGAGAYSEIKATSPAGEVAFNDLALGFYKVEEQANAGVTSTPHSFIISVPMTNPEGSGFLYDVHVYPKNDISKGAIMKRVLDENGDEALTTIQDVGKEVSWVITNNIPGNIGSANINSGDYFTITDELDKSLTLKANGISITAGGVTLNKDADYTVAQTTTANGNKVVISFTQAAVSKLVAAQSSSNDAGQIKVKVTTTINQNALDGMASNPSYKISNNASFDWKIGDDEGGGTTVPEPGDPDPVDPPAVIVSGVLIVKSDDKGNPLAGAKFAAYDNTNAADDKDNTYITQKTTDGKGYAYFGSKDDLNNYGTYYMAETEAPSNYKLIGGHTTVTLSASNPSKVLSIVNYPENGFILPVTGGTGAILFTAGGLLLIGAAVVFMLMSKKRRTEQ